MEIPVVLAFVLCTTMTSIILILNRNKLEGSKFRFFIIWTFLIYISAVISITQFPLPFGEGIEKYTWNRQSVSLGSIHDTVNIIPFKSLVHATRDLLAYTNGAEDFITTGELSREFIIYFINIVGNILLFVPLGFYLVLLVKNILFKNIFVIAAVSALSIEAVQFMTNLLYGFTLRDPNIDDVILNVFGAIIGFFLALIVVRIIGKFKVDT